MKELTKVFSDDLTILIEWIAKREYMGMCVGTLFVWGPRKRWIGSVNGRLKKRSHCWATKKDGVR